MHSHLCLKFGNEQRERLLKSSSKRFEIRCADQGSGVALEVQVCAVELHCIAGLSLHVFRCQEEILRDIVTLVP